MLQLAVGNDPRFGVSDIELKREGLSYTIDTIREMKRVSLRPTRSCISSWDGTISLKSKPGSAPRDIMTESIVLVADRPPRRQ